MHNVKRDHLKNCKVLPTRDHLMIDLPKNAVIAELGVFKGVFARRMYDYTKPKKMYLVDTWPQGKGMEQVKKLFEKEIAQNVVEVIQQDSVEFLNSLENNFFDWVYLDTSHEYEQTIKELSVLQYKVKEGGYIAGHDFCKGNPETKTKYGVIPACHEFCLFNDWEYAYITVDVPGHFSYCLKKRV